MATSKLSNVDKKRFKQLGDGSFAETFATTPGAVTVENLLKAAVSIGPGLVFDNVSGPKHLATNGSVSSGTGSALVSFEGTFDSVNWEVLAVITLTLGTTVTGDSFVSDNRYLQLRANITSISGTGATVNAFVGY